MNIILFYYRNQILAIGQSWLLVYLFNSCWQYKAQTNSIDLEYLNEFNGDNDIHDIFVEIG